MAIMIYIYIFILVYRKRDEINGNVLFSVMIFLLLPIIGTFIQLTNSNVIVLWASTAVSVLFIYLLFETTSSARDFLTGVYRRSRTEEYIETLLRKKRVCTVIMIDIDDFKTLNDTFGHPTGDRVLVEFGKVLTKIFRIKAIVSRFGGDEFIVVLEGTHGDSFDFYKREIKRLLELSDHLETQSVNFSIGAAYCNNPMDATIEGLMIEADNNMYLDKDNNKNKRRRKSD